MSVENYLFYFNYKYDMVHLPANTPADLKYYEMAIRIFNECGFTTTSEQLKFRAREIARQYITRQINELFDALPPEDQFDLMAKGESPSFCKDWDFYEPSLPV